MAKKKTKAVDWRVLMAVVAAITIIECVALANGINGTLMSVVLVLLGGIAGVTLPIKSK